MAEFIVKSKKYGEIKVLIDDEDYDYVSVCTWHLSVDYIRKSTNPKTMLHRYILSRYQDISGKMVDHMNHDTFDNRKENLRACASMENSSNKRIDTKKTLNSTSKYKGVHWNKSQKKWCAFIGWAGGKDKAIGYFDSEIKAAKAYDQMARILHREFAFLNFPEIYGNFADVDKFFRIFKETTVSKYYGVVLIRKTNTWVYRIKINGKVIGSKQYRLEIEAAKARDEYIVSNLDVNKYKLNFY